MKPFIKLEDGTLIVTCAIGATTSTGDIRAAERGQQQIRTTRVLSTSAAVLYEMVKVLNINEQEAISRAAHRHRAVVAAVEEGLT